MKTVPFELIVHQFTIGNWKALSDQQKRVFVTYAKANYGGEIGNGDAIAFSIKLWNDSADAANARGIGANDRLLEQSQLTTFLGVTSMWEKREVIHLIEIVSHINGDQAHNNFRLYGALSDSGGESVKKTFKHNIAGSGHGEYSVSRREQGLWGQPNGQFSMTPDLVRFDSDIDYRRLVDPGHNTKENSDVRAFEGSTPHLTRHVSRYGPIPITMKDTETVLLSARAGESPCPEAVELGLRFIQEFESALTIAAIYEELFVPDAIRSIRETGVFNAIGLTHNLINQLNDSALKNLFVAFMDFYYLHAKQELMSKNIVSGFRVDPVSDFTIETESAIRSSTFLSILLDDSASDSLVIGSMSELTKFLGELDLLNRMYREQFRTLLRDCRPYQTNLKVLNDIGTVEVGRSDSDVGGQPKYVLEKGIYVIVMVRVGPSLRISSLGIGN